MKKIPTPKTDRNKKYDKYSKAVVFTSAPTITIPSGQSKRYCDSDYIRFELEVQPEDEEKEEEISKPNAEVLPRYFDHRQQIEAIKRIVPIYDDKETIGMKSKIDFSGLDMPITLGKISGDFDGVDLGNLDATSDVYFEAFSNSVVDVAQMIADSDVPLFSDFAQLVIKHGEKFGMDLKNKAPFSNNRFSLLVLDEDVMFTYVTLCNKTDSKEGSAIVKFVDRLGKYVRLMKLWLQNQRTLLKIPSDFLQVKETQMVYVAEQIENTPGIVPNVFLFLDALNDECSKSKSGANMDFKRVRKCLERFMDSFTSGMHKLLVIYTFIRYPGIRGLNNFYHAHHTDPISSAILVEGLSRRIRDYNGEIVSEFDPILLTFDKIQNPEDGNTTAGFYAFCKFDSLYRKIHRFYIEGNRVSRVQLQMSEIPDEINLFKIVGEIRTLIGTLKSEKVVPWKHFMETLALELSKTSNTGFQTGLARSQKKLKDLQDKITKLQETDPISDELKPLQEKYTDLNQKIVKSIGNNKRKIKLDQWKLFVMKAFGGPNADANYDTWIENNKNTTDFIDLTDRKNKLAFKITDKFAPNLFAIILDSVVEMESGVEDHRNKANVIEAEFNELKKKKLEIQREFKKSKKEIGSLEKDYASSLEKAQKDGKETQEIKTEFEKRIEKAKENEKNIKDKVNAQKKLTNDQKGADTEKKKTLRTHRKQAQEIVTKISKSSLFKTYCLEFLYFATSMYASVCIAKTFNEKFATDGKMLEGFEGNIQDMKSIKSPSEAQAQELKEYIKAQKEYNIVSRALQREWSEFVKDINPTRYSVIIDNILKELNGGRMMEKQLSKPSPVGKKRTQDELEAKIGYKITTTHINIVTSMYKTGVLKLTDGYDGLGRIVGIHPEAVKFIIQNYSK